MTVSFTTFQYPGVYLEEIGTRMHPIDGVPLATGMHASATPGPVHVPGWTDHNSHDPGQTLLAFLAFAADSTAYRADRALDPDEASAVFRHKP